MDSHTKKLLIVLVLSALCLSLASCTQKVTRRDSVLLEQPEVINATIGEIAEIRHSGPALQVHGFGIVAGLNGTGSSECPPDLRQKLIKEIKVEMTDGVSVNAREFINSKDTAVVEIFGVTPALAERGDVFDLRIAPLPGSQTTSLKGGRLYTSKLVEYSPFMNVSNYSKTLAYAEGAVFVNQFSDKNPDIVGDYVLAGGRVLEVGGITMTLFKPNYTTAARIRNIINGKFGVGTALAKTPQSIVLKVPNKYRYQKQRFLAMVRSIYITEDPAKAVKWIDSLVNDLVNNDNKLSPEIALETAGKPAIASVSRLLRHPDEKVRFHAARCILNIDMNHLEALKTLEFILRDKKSNLRVEAVKAIARGARLNDAVTIIAPHLESDDFKVSFAVYDELRKMRYTNISRYIVNNDFFLDTVMSEGKRRIYVNRTGTPKIILFGEPMKCSQNLFVQFDEMGITINSRVQDDEISVFRKNPKRPGVIKRQSTFSVRDLIRTLGESPVVSVKSFKRPGLAVPYYQIAEILQQMCKSGDIDAEFILGDMPVFPQIDKPVEMPILPPTIADKPDTEPYKPADPGTSSAVVTTDNRRTEWKVTAETKYGTSTGNQGTVDNSGRYDAGDDTLPWKELIEDKDRRKEPETEDTEKIEEKNDGTPAWKELLP